MAIECCNRSIIDVDCINEDGKFILGIPAGCLPGVFTVRFRAPADYVTGNVVVFKDMELPVRTPGMEAAASGIFKSGGIVHCDIDLVRKIAFIGQGAEGGVSVSAYPGEYREFFLAPEDLPFGWRFPSGEYVEKTSAVGKALLALNDKTRSYLGVVEQGTTIRLFNPGIFFVQTDEGMKGRFARPVNGADFDPGHTENDAIRNIEGEWIFIGEGGTVASRYGTVRDGTQYKSEFSGALTKGALVKNAGMHCISGLGGVEEGNRALRIDASLVVPTAAENRPYWFGVTPAIYIGA